MSCGGGNRITAGPQIVYTKKSNAILLFHPMTGPISTAGIVSARSAVEMQEETGDIKIRGAARFSDDGVQWGTPIAVGAYQTADGNYDPTRGYKSLEKYSPADLTENPSLAQMTGAALRVLQENPNGFWIMIEAGDVDWANHDDNIDNSIGAVFSGDEAVKSITDWIEARDAWEESALIITADHGHYFHLVDPQALVAEPVPAGEGDAVTIK